MTTDIKKLSEEIKNVIINFDDDKLSEYILDFSLPQEARVKALERFNKLYPDDIVEILMRLTSMYQLNGIEVLKNFLIEICINSSIYSILKVEASKALILFEEFEEDSSPDDDDNTIIFKKSNNLVTRKNNEDRKEIGYSILNKVCSNFNIEDIPTPIKIDSVCLLMQSENYAFNADLYFKNIIDDLTLDCDFRYKTILSLENKDILNPEKFIISACDWFLHNVKNRTMYRILSAQYILQHDTSITENSRELIENILLEFSTDTQLDYNLRADATDTLLNLGSEKSKSKARHIILELGHALGNVKTVFDNAQNVHNMDIEDSISEILEFLTSLPLMKIGEALITFEYVSGQIEKMIKPEKQDYIDYIPCMYCGNEKNQIFCSLDCSKQFQKSEKIKISLNRIYMDRVLYSKFNNTLVNILLKVWTYLSGNEFEEEMKNRMLQELEEMSGTCSSGFASRLVNVISGFGKFNIRISWDDQIVSNFTGRLNAVARKITETNSPFYNERMEDVVELWLNSNDEIKLKTKQEIEKPLIHHQFHLPMKDIIIKFLDTDRDEKIKICVEDFSEAVLNEMIISTNKFEERQNFLLFFRTSMSKIREELYLEFKEFVEDNDFDLAFRKAIFSYEGC